MQAKEGIEKAAILIISVFLYVLYGVFSNLTLASAFRAPPAPLKGVPLRTVLDKLFFPYLIGSLYFFVSQSFTE
jgi:hypothetical protein